MLLHVHCQVMPYCIVLRVEWGSTFSCHDFSCDFRNNLSSISVDDLTSSVTRCSLSAINPSIYRWKLKMSLDRVLMLPLCFNVPAFTVCCLFPVTFLIWLPVLSAGCLPTCLSTVNCKWFQNQLIYLGCQNSTVKVQDTYETAEWNKGLKQILKP